MRFPLDIAWGLLWTTWAVTVIFLANCAVIFYLPLLWLSPQTFRTLSNDIAGQLWPGLLFCISTLGGHRFYTYGDKLNGKSENALVIVNY